MTTQERMEHKRYSFEVFCKTLLRNKARNLHKKENRIDRHEMLFADFPSELEALLCYDDHYDLFIHIPIKSSNDEFVVENEALASALTFLLPKYKDVLFLSYFMEYSDREIAQLLGIPSGTVNSQRIRAIKRLREQMGAKDE